MKVENQDVKEYLINFTVSTLENCKLFKKIYGKGFAKRRLDTNVSKVYTNDEKDDVAGYYTLSELSITICNQGKDILMPEDIEQDKEYKQTVLHESIHAILKRTKQECKKLKIKNGTGMRIQFEEGEIGRGLNEGLTNWICEKAGLESETYKRLTNFIKIIELAIGEESVMKFGRGHLAKEYPKLMHLDRKKAWKLIALADEIYADEKDLRRFERITNVLSNYHQNRDGKDSDKWKKAKEDLENLKPSDILYIKDFIVGNSEYANWLKAERKNNTDESIIEFLHRNAKEKEAKIQTKTNRFLSTVFYRYFKTDVDNAMSAKQISAQEMKKIDKLYKLFYDTQRVGEILPPEFGVFEEPELEEFMHRQHNLLEKKYTNQISAKAKNRPTVKKSNPLSIIALAIKNRISRSNEDEVTYNNETMRTDTQKDIFRETLSDMTKYDVSKKDNSYRVEEETSKADNRENEL